MRWIVILYGVFISASVCANGEVERDNIVVMTRVGHRQSRAFSDVLPDVERNATDALVKKYPDFDSHQRPSFSMDPKSKREFLIVMYNVGDRYWFVHFDREFKLKKIETRMMRPE
jgi:hypothetical protein